MSQEQGNGAEPQVKVRDRRRFTPDGDIVTVTGAGDESQEAIGPEPEAVQDQRDAMIAQQTARIDELTRAYAAMVEEGKAARVRMEREKARVLEAERAQLARALFEGVDDLERALAAAGDATGPLVEGVRLTLASLAKKVGELGVERIPVLGLRFDPSTAEAVDLVQVEDPSQEEIVVEEVRAGYRQGSRVLRPATVRVGRMAPA